jgi:hypothetical protein
MLKRKYIKLVAFFSAFNWLICFSRAALLPHFLKEGLNFQQIIFAAMLSFWAVLAIILLGRQFIHKVGSRRAWYIAVILSMIYILLLVNIKTPYQLYAAYFINGLITYFFYVFYNTAHFEATPKEHTGKSSALVFSIGPVISLVAPLLAGTLAEINYLYVWIASFIFFLVPLYFVKFQDNFSIQYEIGEALEEIKSTRLFIFLGAFWEAMNFGIIPVYTLFFIKTPLGYGAYLSYLGLVSILANLLLGTFSDKIQKRILFLYPITIIMSALTMLFVLATSNIYYWIILSGAIQFFYPLYNNFALAMVVDTDPNLKKAVVGRELVLSAGRIIGLSLAFISFVFEARPFYIFIILGSGMLIFPLALFWRTRFAKKYSYI